MSDSTGSFNYHVHLEVSVQAALEAGAYLRSEFHRPSGPRGSGGHAPADTEAEALIRDRLETAFPSYGFRGEEIRHRDRSSLDPKGHRWLIDPNDGTQAFLQGMRGSVVSIALMRGDLPVLGVVYAFVAPDDRGDLFTWAEGCGPLQRNSEPVERRWSGKMSEETTVLISQAADEKSSVNAKLVAPARFRAVPSIAYRLALVAAGEGEVGISIAGPTDWDVAGGHALLRGVGGELFDHQGKPIRYDRWYGGDVFGGDPELAPALARRNWQQIWRTPRESSKYLDLCALKPGHVINNPKLLSRAQGCLLGQLAGDSLGSLVEFRGSNSIQRQYPEGVRHLADGGTWNTLAGQPTDDSELALMLARTLVKVGDFNEEAVARSYAFWYASHPFDIGGTTSQALSAAHLAVQKNQAIAAAARQAGKQQSQANGALMRVSPLGIFGHQLSPEHLAKLARADATLTHPHRVCQDASALFAVTIAHAISSGSDAEESYRYALAWAQDHTLHEDILETLKQAQTDLPSNYMHQMGWVRIALQNAFWQLLHTPSLERGIMDTVGRGGDTDTNGAIAGALLGAVHGRESIPTQWYDRILCCRPIKRSAKVHQPRPRPFWGVDAMQLAECLLWAGSECA